MYRRWVHGHNPHDNLGLGLADSLDDGEDYEEKEDEEEDEGDDDVNMERIPKVQQD